MTALLLCYFTTYYLLLNTLKEHLGSFAVGKQFDALVVDASAGAYELRTGRLLAGA